MKNYLNLIKHLNKHKKIFIHARGFSMMPLIENGDLVEVMRTEEIKNNDIVLYISKANKLILHRYINNFFYPESSIFSKESINGTVILGKAIRIIKIKKGKILYSPFKKVSIFSKLFYYIKIKFNRKLKK